MSKQVLFVDDEVSLLNGIERRLAGQFNLATANSGAAALDLMQSNGPFAVVVTDMRMPKMDGVQLIKEARSRWPDTVYIMLTGNQDQATAVQALNEGHVFRFLTKPCQSAELTNAVEAGLRQFQLETGEKELLQKTFCGAVSVLTDVLALSHPNIFSRTERIEHICADLQEEMDLGDHWEYKLSAKLGLLGFALLPESERANVDMGTQLGGVVSDQLRRRRHRSAADRADPATCDGCQDYRPATRRGRKPLYSGPSHRRSQGEHGSHSAARFHALGRSSPAGTGRQRGHGGTASLSAKALARNVRWRYSPFPPTALTRRVSTCRCAT